MEEQKDELARFEENARELGETLKQVRNIQEQKITISNGAASLVVGIVGVAALMFAVFAVREAGIKTDSAVREATIKTEAQERIHAVELKAATDDMAQIRARLMQLEQYRTQHDRRLNELENPTDGK